MIVASKSNKQAYQSFSETTGKKVAKLNISLNILLNFIFIHIDALIMEKVRIHCLLLLRRLTIYNEV